MKAFFFVAISVILPQASCFVAQIVLSSRKSSSSYLQISTRNELPKLPFVGSASTNTKNEDKAAADVKIDPAVHASGHKKWGIDNNCPSEYWFDGRIHTFGNTGFGGAFHAAVAPISTKVIDVVAYDGIDIRLKVAEKLKKLVWVNNPRVLDMCCGVGISTRALKDAFPHAETVIGIDTSAEMVAMAEFLDRHLAFVKPLIEAVTGQLTTISRLLKEQQGKIKAKSSKIVDRAASCPMVSFLRKNAESTNLPDRTFDVITIMYAFHEAPKAGRAKILNEARRLLRPGGVLAVVDISTDYTPSKSMLSGEPYVIEYQKNINRQMTSFGGFVSPKYETLVPGHVGMWTLRRSRATF